jgi:hypothetical protein
MSNWAIAILPLVGVLVGATLQFLLSRAANREKHTEDLRSKAYADFLRAVAAAVHLRSDEDLRDVHRDVADAKARIAIYGSASVVGALARFEEVGAVLTVGPPLGAFIAVVSSMRLAGAPVADRDIRLLLVGAER